MPSIFHLTRKEIIDFLTPLLAERRKQAKEATILPKQEYLALLELIKKIDITAYDLLLKEEKALGEQPLERALGNDWGCGQHYRTGKLAIGIKPILDLPEQEQINYLKPLLAMYKEAYKNYRVSLSSAEYKNCMNLAKEINSNFYTELEACQKATGKPCLERGRKPEIISNFNTSEYQTIVLPLNFNTWSKELQKKYLACYQNAYKRIPPITQDERNKVLEAIKAFTPKLYDRIIAVDPTGQTHILRHNEHNGTSVFSSYLTGLPVIQIGSEAINEPTESFMFCIAHELSHYILGHCEKKSMIRHSQLDKDLDTKTNLSKNILPFHETFKNSAQRIREYEADAYAIVILGAPLQGALSWMEQNLQQNHSYTIDKNLKKETFKSTHPLWQQRINHLKSLERDKEWHDFHPADPVDWDALIDTYKGKI